MYSLTKINECCELYALKISYFKTLFNTVKKHSLLLAILLCLQNISHAQSGWDLIKANKNLDARESFLTTLKKDSMDVEALKGIIYLCGVDYDDYYFNSYCQRLVNKLKIPSYYYVFDSRLSYSASEKNDELPEYLKQQEKLNEAREKFYTRKFEEAKTIYNQNVSNLKWAMMGPFKNINGYGYEQQYSPELNSFEYDKNKTYLNHNKIDLKWITPLHSNEKGYIDFESHCMRENNGIYYANTFIQLSSSKKIRLNISRKYPLKMFFDDQLVMEQKEQVTYSIDGEWVEIDAKEGWHRIMIKYCVGNYFSGKFGGNIWDSYSYSDDEYDSYGGNHKVHNDILSNIFDDYGNYEALSLKITDESGKIIPVNSTWDLMGYIKEKLITRLNEKTELNYFKEEISKSPNDWFNYYMYYKAAIKSGYANEIEEFALQTLQKNEDAVFFKMITNEIFTENGKKEKAEKIISGIDSKTCPVYKLLYDELKQIDRDNEPNLYLNKLNEMRKISPSNLNLIKRLLDFYEKQGKTADKKTAAKGFIKQYPNYNFQLANYLEDSNKPKDYDIGNHYDYTAKKAEKAASKNIKKYYSIYDYEVLIKKYKGINKPANALAIYDEILKIEPDNFDKRKEKAEYLFNLEKYSEALAVLETVLASQPYNGVVYELMGDIYKDKNENENALKFYKKAKKYSGDLSSSLYGLNLGGGGTGEIDEKIDKIQGQKLLKSKFNSKTLDEIIANETGMEKYTDEESVILGFIYDVIVEEEGSANLFTKFAVKILSDAGAKTWTEYDFSFLGNLTTCKVIKANGTEFNPDKSGGFVVFKNLEPGDIIKLEGNYKWDINTELGKEFIQFNYLNFPVPIRYSKFEYGIAKNLDFNYLLNNADDVLKTRETEEFNFYRFEYNDFKKVSHEEAIVDQTDIYSSLMVTTMKDWSPVVEWFKAKTYRKLEPNYELRAVHDSIIKPGMSDMQKVIAIYNYITKEIKYSYTRLLQSNYIPKNTDLTISSHIGDCKDVASLMISLLRMEGIESYYCLVKTNQFFHLKILPSLYFDHVIAAYVLDGKMHYADLTTDYYPDYVLNENDVNAWGLLIKDGEKELFLLPGDHLNPTKNLTTHNITANLNKDKSVNIQVSSTFGGMTGGLLREVNAMKSKDNFEQDILYYLGDGQFDNLSFEDYNFANMEEISAPLNGNFTFRAMNFSDNIVDIYFTQIPFMQGMKTTNIFSSNKRFNTINLGDICRITPVMQKVTLTFPPGTTVRKMPSNVNLDNEFFKYSLTFSKTKNGIYTERYQEFKTDIIKPGDFKKFRELYLQLLDHDKTKIGLIVN